MEKKQKTIYIHTFGCQQNVSDSERIAGYYEKKGYKLVESPKQADIVVINTCMVREQAEEKIYGFAKKMKVLKKKKPGMKIIISGCLIGTTRREKGHFFKDRLKNRLPMADEFKENNEFNYDEEVLRYQSATTNSEDNDLETHAWVSISNGCSNYCSFCIVPFARGPEVSRSVEEILAEIKELVEAGYDRVTLLGQNVNSYGNDIMLKIKNQKSKFRDEGAEGHRDKEVGDVQCTIYNVTEKKKRGVVVPRTDTKVPNNVSVEPTTGFDIENLPKVVDSMGKKRVPTLFPYLLEKVCEIEGLVKVSFMSSNPWDFSDELIEVIAKNSKIDRTLHLPLQAGDDEVLKRMKRFYTKKDYLNLVEKIKRKVPDVVFTTDIIVGFPGETDEAFENTVDVCQKVKFQRAYIARYSERKGTLAAKKYKDDIRQKVKRERFHRLDSLIHN